MQKTINLAWHQKNKLPEKSTMRERIDWHMAHAANCACRPMPPSVREAMKEDGFVPQSRDKVSVAQPSRSRRRTSAKPKSR
jgi:hypothetical protein